MSSPPRRPTSLSSSSTAATAYLYSGSAGSSAIGRCLSPSGQTAARHAASFFSVSDGTGRRAPGADESAAHLSPPANGFFNEPDDGLSGIEDNLADLAASPGSMQDNPAFSPLPPPQNVGAAGRRDNLSYSSSFSHPPPQKDGGSGVQDNPAYLCSTALRPPPRAVGGLQDNPAYESPLPPPVPQKRDENGMQPNSAYIYSSPLRSPPRSDHSADGLQDNPAYLSLISVGGGAAITKTPPLVKGAGGGGMFVNPLYGRRATVSPEWAAASHAGDAAGGDGAGGTRSGRARMLDKPAARAAAGDGTARARRFQLAEAHAMNGETVTESFSTVFLVKVGRRRRAVAALLLLLLLILALGVGLGVGLRSSPQAAGTSSVAAAGDTTTTTSSPPLAPTTTASASFQGTERLFTLLSATLNWEECESACGGRSHMACFSTQEEEDEALSFFGPRWSDRFWLGIRSDAERNWLDCELRVVWRGNAAGQAGVGYSGWNPTQPSDSGGNEDCVENKSQSNGWNDLPCASETFKLLCICSRPL